jgi:hypothetical protein
MSFAPYLHPFRRRVKALLVLKGLTVGLLIGGLLGSIAAVLDWRGVMDVEWPVLAGLAGLCGGIGVVSSLFLSPSLMDVAASVDRRARLKDRLGSAATNEDGTPFSGALRQDAERTVAALNPGQIYPLKWTRLHVFAVAALALAFGGLFLSRSDLQKSKEALAAKAEMQRDAAKIDQLRKDIFDDPVDKPVTSPELMALQKDLYKLKKDLERSRIDPKEAMRRQEELAEKAAELAKNSAAEMLKNVDEGQSMLDKALQAELEKNGFADVDLESAKMSPEESQAAQNQAKERFDDAKAKQANLKNQLGELNKALKDAGLSKSERDAMEKLKKELEEALKDAELEAAKAAEQLEKLQLSQKARQALAEIMNDPLYKKLQEALKKMKSSAQSAANGAAPKLSKEERQKLHAELQKMLEQLAGDEEARKALLEKMLAALECGGGT